MAEEKEQMNCQKHLVKVITTRLPGPRRVVLGGRGLRQDPGPAGSTEVHTVLGLAAWPALPRQPSLCRVIF